MSEKVLITLGTSSALPTRTRNHNGYLLRWGAQGILFDCGEGTQRQMTYAGVSSRQIDVICLTHLHGDHCLGLPGVLQRISLDSPGRAITLVYPEEGQDYVDRLRTSSIFYDQAEVTLLPVAASDDPREVLRTPDFVLSAASLEHRVPTLGYRVEDLPQISFDAEALAARGIAGPTVGQLRREGKITVDGVTTRLEEVTRDRPIQSFAFIMDTVPCNSAERLAEGANLMVMEATYTHSESHLAHDHGHSTAVDAAHTAAAAGVELLALSHFSTRYSSTDQHLAEARGIHTNTVALADLDTVPIPRR